MRLKFRVDAANPRHVTFTVFQDGGNCGRLVMETYAFFILARMLEKSESEVLEFEVEK